MSHTDSPTGGTGGPERSVEIDWMAAENSPEFQDLVKRKRSFVVPATIFFLVWYSAFILLAGYAEDFMGSSVYEGLTVGYLLALTQFLMVWGLGWAYLRYCDRVLDPLRQRVEARALETRPAAAASGDGARAGAEMGSVAR